jgi:hypothetical protein
MNRSFVSRVLSASAVFALLAVVLAVPVRAQASQAAETNAKPVTHFGLLRVRDLTPFGFLRLDMRPAHAVSGPPGAWGVELELGYQNTWVLSPNVEQYLTSLPGRRPLGPNEIQAIRDLPGEAYLVDLELALLDATYHYKLTHHWGVYAVLSAVSYNGGFLDSTVESFHDTFGFSSFGRPAVNRNDVNVILDLKKTQLIQPELPEGGLLDPTFGVRYTAAPYDAPWNMVVEAAVKVPIDGARPFLSTGNADFGTQITLQRFLGKHAGYASLAAVYTQGSDIAPATYSPQVVPTLILGYEYQLSGRTNLIAQTYASRSVFSRDDTDLEGLLQTKYQISAGVRYRFGTSVLSFAVTENFGSFNNTPDVGFQIGWAYSPVFKH